MDEQATQGEVAEVEELDYILPDGYDEESTTFDDVEDADTEEESTEKVEGESTEEPTEEEATQLISELLGIDKEVKVNKEMIDIDSLGKEGIESALRKGLAYDTKLAKVQDRLDVVMNESNELGQIADLFGMDSRGLLDALLDQHYNRKAETEQRNVSDVRKEYEAGKKDRQTIMVERFVEKYPDLNPDDLPESVQEDVKNGMDISQAYESHLKDEDIKAKEEQIAELESKVAEFEKKLKTNEQNKKTKQKGVVKSVSGNDNAHDDFLDGLLG